MPRVRLWMGKGGHIYHGTTSVVICKDKWTQQAESFCSEGYLFAFQWYPFENLRLKGNGLKKEPVGIIIAYTGPLHYGDPIASLKV